MPAKRKVPPDNVVVAAYRSGMSCREIGRQYGCNARSVWSLLDRIGEPRRSLSEAAKLAVIHGRASGQFPKRNVPWNKGLKGLHLSEATEFQPGHKSNRRYPVGTVRVRVRRRDGKLREARAYVKVRQSNVWRLRCHVNWEKEHGKIPRGMLIHHKNGDGMNDTMSNLALLTRAEHLAIHRPEYEHKRQARASKATKRRWAEYRQKPALPG